MNVELPRVHQHTLAADVGTDGFAIVFDINCYCVTNHFKTE